jgi:hypothetical protein
MTIKIEEYLIEQEQTYPVYWNLYKVGIVKDKNSKNFGEETQKAIVYGVTLPSAVHHIIQERAADYELVVSLKNYVELYEKSVKKLITIINEQFNVSGPKL